MKNTLSLICLFACVLLLISCERETDEVFESETSNISSTITNESNINSSSDGFSGGSCWDTIDIFEAQLQWVSSIAVAVMQDNSAAKSEFFGELAINIDGTIDIDRIIGPNAVHINFRDDFEAKLLWHIKNPYGHPNNTTPPPIPPHIGGFTSQGDNTSFTVGGTSFTPVFDDDDIYQEKLQGFYDTVLNLNCIELFLPEGLNFSGEYYSTSHPLTTASCNEAIKSVKSPISGWWGAITTPTIVNELSEYNNLIIARPVRPTFDTTPEDPCQYTQYPGIDFTLFMD